VYLCCGCCSFRRDYGDVNMRIVVEEDPVRVNDELMRIVDNVSLMGDDVVDDRLFLDDKEVDLGILDAELVATLDVGTEA
jgi:hypothetical protein